MKKRKVAGEEILSEKQMKMFDDFDTQILAASIRTVFQWRQAALSGADVVTLPPSVFEQGLKHPLTDRGVELFDNDWKKLGKASLL